MLRILVVAVAVALLADWTPSAEALTCPRWNPAACEGAPCPELTDCPPGDVQDDGCSCCPVCARQLGQTCGGIYRGSPQCGAALRCHKEPLKEHEIAYNQDGICVEDN